MTGGFFISCSLLWLPSTTRVSQPSNFLNHSQAPVQSHIVAKTSMEQRLGLCLGRGAAPFPSRRPLGRDGGRSSIDGCVNLLSAAASAAHVAHSSGLRATASTGRAHPEPIGLRQRVAEPPRPPAALRSCLRRDRQPAVTGSAPALRVGVGPICLLAMGPARRRQRQPRLRSRFSGRERRNSGCWKRQRRRKQGQGSVHRPHIVQV